MKRISRPQKAALWLIRQYQKWISPMLAPRCRFYPTCSQYAVEAIRYKGVLRGSLLALWRLLRCHPWHPGGYDPVPGTDASGRPIGSSSEQTLIDKSSISEMAPEEPEHTTKAHPNHHDPYR